MSFTIIILIIKNVLGITDKGTKKSLSIKDDENSCQPTQKSKIKLIVKTVVDTVGVDGGGWGFGSRIEEITYIVPFLALGVVESAGLAVAASLGVVPIVPRGRTLGARGERGARRLLSVVLVLGVQSGRAETHSNTRGKAQPPYFPGNIVKIKIN